MQTKKCTKCGKRMSINKFYRASGNLDGYRNDCKNCKNENRRSNYYKNVTGKLDVLKEVKAPKLNTVEIEKAVMDLKEAAKTIQYRINNFNRVKTQRNIAIVSNLLAIGYLLFLILK